MRSTDSTKLVKKDNCSVVLSFPCYCQSFSCVLLIKQSASCFSLCRCLRNYIPSTFFLGCFPCHLIFCKTILAQVVLWLEDSLFTASFSAAIIWYLLGFFLPRLLHYLPVSFLNNQLINNFGKITCSVNLLCYTWPMSMARSHVTRISTPKSQVCSRKIFSGTW